MRRWAVYLGFFATVSARAQPVDLLERYPTPLTGDDTTPGRARAWTFDSNDIYQVTHFSFASGDDLQVETGPSDLGIGHCPDGAVWAVLIPRRGGTLARNGANPEGISFVWLRFHPKEISRLFPPETVAAGGATKLLTQMRVIAQARIDSSFYAGERVMIPEPKDMTVDIDTKTGARRFFIVDTASKTTEYVPDFEARAMKAPPAVTAALAASAFDQLWEAFDRNYAMFMLRPEVNWAKLRDEYRPKALAAESAYEVAGVCADMLKKLRDLHVWLTIGGADVPVFDRPRPANANPHAWKRILGHIDSNGRILWAVTMNNVGFIAVMGLSDTAIPDVCDQVLEKMRQTRGLIVDVRLNGGGSEDLGIKIAGRFLEKEFVYASDQSRNGPSHTDLTAKLERRVAPRGPWRYDRPVILLVGRKCMSSAESFAGMMTGDPQVTTMGDPTCGSSGNPRIVSLPLDMTVSVPQWIDYRPDGTPLDERGFTPTVSFHPVPGAYEGNRDDLLAAALARLASK